MKTLTQLGKEPAGGQPRLLLGETLQPRAGGGGLSETWAAILPGHFGWSPAATWLFLDKRLFSRPCQARGPWAARLAWVTCGSGSCHHIPAQLVGKSSSAGHFLRDQGCGSGEGPWSILGCFCRRAGPSAQLAQGEWTSPSSAEGRQAPCSCSALAASHSLCHLRFPPWAGGATIPSSRLCCR